MVANIEAQAGPVEGLADMLSAHPSVELLPGVSESSLDFRQGDRIRKIWVDRPTVVPFGLVELIDNNPLVCADEFSVPSPEATLALIALGPLLRAGILCEPPTALFSFEVDVQSVTAALTAEGWNQGLTAAFEVQNLRSILAATFIAVVGTPSDSTLIDALYDEVFGSSFYVHREEEGDWRTEIVSGKPFAAYRLRYAPDEPQSLLTIRVMADSLGKCGAAQIVHAFNIMCGFEESLAIL